MKFDGKDYVEHRDHDRLERQYDKVFKYMSDGEWHRLNDISKHTGAPEASASACLRDFRKERNGSHKVHKRYISNGLYEYMLEVNHE